jgi:hypothetical protein
MLAKFSQYGKVLRAFSMHLAQKFAELLWSKVLREVFDQFVGH